jgi:serine/threonine-protein kinase
MVPVAKSVVTLPDCAVAATTTAPTEIGEGLGPDLLEDPGFADRYAVGEPLGEGGMGVVRLCVDHRIGREVAIKSVQPAKGSRSDLAARFFREACVQAQLEHPSIVPVYDVGRDPNGTLYFTMKRVRGMTFERIVDRLRVAEGKPPVARLVSEAVEDSIRPMSRRKLLTAFASVCHAVDFAHSRGVIHRDLKPGNVMLGDFGEVYVLDWGVAKIVGVPELPEEDPSPLGTPDGRPPSPSSATGDSASFARTRRGATMGTPGYMAPEQARGDVVDCRADVYALGAILFELLTLEPLHAHTTGQAALDSTLSGVDARPSARAPDRDVPPELDSICGRAIAHAPEDRYAAVRELVDALELYLDGDRDLARRRELARDHAHAADEHAVRALAEGRNTTSSRSRALNEVGRAIALDPTNEDAVRTLMRLMTAPPAEMPDEARAAMRAQMQSFVRAGSLSAALAYLTWFGYLPILLWMGIRSWTAVLAMSAAWLAAAAVSFRAARKPARDGKASLPMMVAGTAGIATSSMLFGPYVLVPTLAALLATLVQMAPNRAHRVPAVVLCCLAIAVPTGLELAGVLPAAYAFDRGAISILPVMVEFPPLPTHLMLLGASIMLIVIASTTLARFRDILTRVEERLHVQAWQLRQLVPEQVRPGSAPPPSERDWFRAAGR